MKKELPTPALAEDGVYQETIREGDEVLLTLSARWPRLEGDWPGARRINRYYETLADRWKRRWTGPLLDQARSGREPGSKPWAAGLEFTVTLLREDCLSLYWEVSEDVGQRRQRRMRQGDAWLMPQGVPLTLRELLPPQRWWRGTVLEEIRRQVGERIQTGESLFFEDWPSLVSRKFSPGRFYLTEEGPAVFYPVESIAPALEGFPTFLLKPAPGE